MHSVNQNALSISKVRRCTASGDTSVTWTGPVPKQFGAQWKKQAWQSKRETRLHGPSGARLTLAKKSGGWYPGRFGGGARSPRRGGSVTRRTEGLEYAGPQYPWRRSLAETRRKRYSWGARQQLIREGPVCYAKQSGVFQRSFHMLRLTDQGKIHTL